MAPAISVSPVDSMFDYPNLRIKVENLRGGQEVTVACVVKSTYGSGDTFVSHGHFKADGNGRVDLSRDPSLGGSYKGVDPIGLLWSLSSLTNKKGAAFVPYDVTVVVEYPLFVIDGYSKPDENTERNYLCKTVCRRHLWHPDITRMEVNAGRIRGTLFYPKHASATNQCPGLIDMYGSRGGINEYRAALMASHGYASLALAYFNYKDLPKLLDSIIDLEYFLEAIDWLLQQPFVKKVGVATVGASLGADLGMLLASITPKVKAVVSINGYHMLNEMWPFKYKGVVLPFRKGLNMEEFVQDGVMDMGAFRRSLSDEPECIYPIEKSNAQYLFICCEKDRNTDAVHTGAILMERLRDHGKEKQGELLVLPGAGHLLEPPYMPLTHLGTNRSYGIFVIFGGEPAAHAKGQVVMWKKTFEFLQRNLGPALPMRTLGVDTGISSRL